MDSPNQERWAELWLSMGAAGDPAPWYATLSEAYREPHRHYHNQHHLSDCLVQFDKVRHLANNPQAVECALWFHDAVYDPKAIDNEEQSASLARHCLTEASLPPSFVELVCRLVLATKTHEVGDESDTALVVDVDLSILGQSEPRFLQYESQILQEYAWVPVEIFASKRTEILQRFLARERIFKTEFFYDLYELAARSNLLCSIRILKAMIA